MPTTADYIITQGDSLPLMRIAIGANSDGQLVDLTGCTVTFLGRPTGTKPTTPPISVPMESFATEQVNGVNVIAVYVRHDSAQTSDIVVPEIYTTMDGELEIIDADGNILTVPSIGYITWYVRNSIGDMVVS